MGKVLGEIGAEVSLLSICIEDVYTVRKWNEHVTLRFVRKAISTVYKWEIEQNLLKGVEAVRFALT
jgi:hypothetical protein